MPVALFQPCAMFTGLLGVAWLVATGCLMFWPKDRQVRFWWLLATGLFVPFLMLIVLALVLAPIIAHHPE